MGPTLDIYRCESPSGEGSQGDEHSFVSRSTHASLLEQDSIHPDSLDALLDGVTPPPPCASLEATLSSLRLLRERELLHGRPDINYLQPDPAPSSGGGGASSCGPEARVTPRMRMIVVSWLAEVTVEFGAGSETLHLSVQLLDRFLNVTPDVPGCVLQLVAVTCFFVACKQLEVAQPTVEQMTAVAASCFTGSDLVRMTRLLLDALEWHVVSPTPHLVMTLVKQQAAPQIGAAACGLAEYILELALLDYALVPILPSQLATAALLLAALTCGDAPAALPPLLASLELELDPALGCALLARLHAVHSAAWPPAAAAAALRNGPVETHRDCRGQAAAAAAAAAASGFLELVAPISSRHGGGGAAVPPLRELPSAPQLAALWCGG